MKHKISDCSNDGDTQCGDCIAGKASMGGAVSECTRCDGPGEYSEPQASVCRIAPAGYKPTETGHSLKTGIEICPKNTFSIGAADKFTECADGGHSNPGESSCEKCSTGKYFQEDENECKPCPKNTFSISGAADIDGCEDCSAGGHSQPGSGYCDQCLTGKFYDEPSNDCKLCPAGTYTATGGVGLDDCKACEIGFYSSDLGSSNCLMCSPGKYTNKEQTACLLCPAGKISGVAVSECTLCEIGKFAEREGNVECEFCNDEEVLGGSTTAGNATVSRSGCICNKSKFENNETATCEKVMEGYCMGEHHCKGGVINDPESLREDGYEGSLYEVCEEGFAAVHSGADLVCNECTGSATQTIAIGFSIIGVIISGVVFWCCRSARWEGSIEERALRASGDLERQSSRARGMSESAREKIEGVTAFIDNAQPYFKILLAYFQVAGGMSSTSRFRFPPMLTSFMNFVKNVLSLDVFSLMPLGRLTFNSNFHYNMLAYTFVPFSIGVLMVVALNVLKRRSSDALKQLANKIFGTFPALSFVILPSISIKVFSNFACHEFDGGYESYLKVEYIIDCDGIEHKVFSVYAFTCVAVFPIRTPLMYFLLLRRERDLLDPRQENFSFQLGSNEEGLKKALEERAKLEETNPSVKRLEFLYKNYEPMNYNFEVFETLRKLILTGGLILMKLETGAQIIAAMLMCLGTMRVYAAEKPFIHHKIDRLSEAAQWQLFFVMFSDLALRVNLDGERLQDRKFFDLMMLIIQFLAPAVMLINKLMKWKVWN
ncbi:hypothetical protein TrLO_g2906 [Triparma laevis f. longispina]|uniref:Tyrosine-protein kinase ephrin type A/B receptor-like domain-containing protein n=1 Tax=Triparma laevis f. longispina TaxID=1714387 RepID=A0A9W7AHS7_9STRA|nr:hypothetical protein TrLO_g2906 [Triparma laevis f. longispina]